MTLGDGRTHTLAYLVALTLAGLGVALAVVGPFRSESFKRADGETVHLPAPERLNHTSDTFDYLQIARQVARGCGYTSLFTYPPFLPESVGFLRPDARRGSSLEAASSLCPSSFPVFWRQPGFPLLIAGTFVLCGKADPAVLPWIQGCAVLFLPLVTFVLARRFLSPGWAALAGLWAVLSPGAVSATSPFVATTWFAVILTFLVAMLFLARRALGLLVVGMLLGAAALFRLETWLLLPGILTMFWLGRSGRRGLALLWILVPAGLIVLPWHLYLWALTGHPFYNVSSLLYHATSAFPGWESSRTLAVRELTPWGFVAAHFTDVLHKTVLDLLRFGRDLVLAPSPLLAPFLWLAVLRTPAERPARAFLRGVAVATAVLVLALAPLEYAPRFLAVLVPCFAVGAALGISRSGRYRRVLAGAATAVGLVFLIGTLSGRRENGTSLLAAEDLNRIMATPAGAMVIATDTVTLADAPTLYAWIWDRPAVWTPMPRDLPAVRALLPGRSSALFTRAAGRGDDLSPSIVADYLGMGGKASATAAPLVVFWPLAEDPPLGVPGVRP